MRMDRLWRKNGTGRREKRPTHPTDMVEGMDMATGVDAFGCGCIFPAGGTGRIDGRADTRRCALQISFISALVLGPTCLALVLVIGPTLILGLTLVLLPWSYYPGLITLVLLPWSCLGLALVLPWWLTGG
jgi:hypothetical protein